jgi:hypothetical protein
MLWTPISETSRLLAGWAACIFGCGPFLFSGPSESGPGAQRGRHCAARQYLRNHAPAQPWSRELPTNTPTPPGTRGVLVDFLLRP